jgi:hypothetical protein
VYEQFTPKDRPIASTAILSWQNFKAKGVLVAEQSGAISTDCSNSAIAIFCGGECDSVGIVTRANYCLALISVRN